MSCLLRPVSTACHGHHARQRSRDRGMALVVVLLFTIALTGIALVSARLALGGEGLARNQLDHQVARQAAEAALRDAERDLLLSANGSATATCPRDADRPVQNQVPRFTANCLRGQCSLNESEVRAVNYSDATSTTTTGEAWWPTRKGGRWNDTASTKPSAGNGGSCATFTGAVPLGTFTGTRAIPAVAQQPEYLLEPLRRGSQLLFRITARGFGYRAGTEVVLQSYFVVPEL
ncbi:MAG: PilX N-terminal domain-containing pilus assembly protein [Aquabacterium commune]|uniref:pilus assembly PilX family protein n=2 Tax=Aquabacterium TaxID=92793 RepID=UPI001D42301E|nr:pilus assembly protein PilX [Aquabacterium sp.]